MNLINKFAFRFCSLGKDHIYEFDRSAISISVRVNQLRQFNEFDNLKALKVHRIVYDLNSDAELMDFLAEHNNEQIKKIFDPNYFIFRGINFHVHTVMRDEKIRKLDSRALLQACQHMFKLKTPENKSQFQVFLSLEHGQKVTNQEGFLQDLKEHMDDLQSVIENSFNFELNNTLHWNENYNFELLFKIVNQQQTLKSLDFSVFKYANKSNSELEQNREILATFYQNATQSYNTIFLKNFQLDKDFVSSQDLSEGVVSYSHVSRDQYSQLMDMLKLMHFRGTLVIDYNKHLERNLGFIDQLLTTSKYVLNEKPALDESHEAHLVENSTPPIDV